MGLDKTYMTWAGQERGVEHQVGGEGDRAKWWLYVPWRNDYRRQAFEVRGKSSDTSRSECVEEGGGSRDCQKYFEKS